MRKRLLAIIATAAMVVAMVPSMVFAGTTVNSSDELQTAFNTGGEVTLGKDLTLTDVKFVVPSGSDVVLDLNGKTISGTATIKATSYLIEVKKGAKLTIKGSGSIVSKAIEPDVDWDPEGFPTYASNTITNRGELIIDGPTIENKTPKGAASYCIDNYDGASLTVESGNIIQSGNDIAIRMSVGSSATSTNVTIKGGLIKGYRAIWIHLPSAKPSEAPDANVTVTGGTLESSDNTYNQAIYVYSYGNSYNNVDVKISGGTLDDVAFTGGTSNGGNGSENVEITGGVINDTYGYGTDDNALGKYIKGGQFNEDVSAYVADDNAMVEVKDAAGNTTYYVGNAVADGVKNAPNGAEITVMKAAEGTELKEVPAGVKVVNDSDNTIKVNGTEVDVEGEITIKAPEKPEKSPETGDNSMAPIAVAGLVLAAMAATVATRRRTN